jgi:hypothetical protein
MYKLRAHYNVSDEIECNKSGHPEFKSIKEVSKALLEKHIKEMGLGI